MRQYIRKYFINPVKEEKWLNEMAEKGLGVVRYSIGKYEFEDIIPGEYTYKVQLLGESVSTLKSQEYLQFLEDMNITCVASYMRWIYLRKIAIDGPIELYSDIKAKLHYYKKVHYIYQSLLVTMLILAGSNFFMMFVSRINSRFNSIYRLNLIGVFILLIVAGILIYADYPFVKQIKHLEKES